MGITVWSFFGVRHKKVAPCIYLNFGISKKKLSVNIWVSKMRIPKIYIFGAPIESEGPGTESSFKIG